MIRWTRQIVLIAGVVLGSPAFAYTALPFESAARDAPRIVLARFSPEGDRARIAVVESVRGDVQPGIVALQHTEWLLPAPQAEQLYVILLADEDRPYVGPLTGDASPANRLPMFMCGVVNAVAIVDGVVVDPTRASGRKVTYEQLKRRLKSGK